MIEENIEIKVHPNNIKWYTTQGFEDIKIWDIINITSSQLPKGSHKTVKVLCDYCLSDGIETIVEKRYHVYINQNENSIIKKDCCKKCTPKKLIVSNMKVYGVENSYQREDVKEKIKQTFIDNYGVENPLQNIANASNERHSFVLESRKQSNLDKYGVENVFANKDIQEKIKETNLRKYGVESPLQNDEILEKVQQTNLERYGGIVPTTSDVVKRKVKSTVQSRYGVDNVMHVEEFKDNMKQTNLEKYGVENYAQTNEYSEKLKQTSLKNYGVTHPWKSPKIREKIYKTNISRYGSKYPMQNKEVAQKAITTMLKGGSILTSSQQDKIFLILKNHYTDWDVVLNFQVSRCVLDISMIKDNTKICVEYDGWYWHQDQIADRRRDEFLKQQGWKVLRIKSAHKVPKIDDVLTSVNKLINTDRTYTEIKLDDWRDVVDE